MPDDVNRENVILDLKDVYGNTIRDRVKVKFYNQIAHSLSQEFDVTMAGSPAVLPGVPAFPTGRAEVYIEPVKYRYKSVFANILPGKQNELVEFVFVDPKKARPRGLNFQDLSGKSYGDELLRILDKSAIGANEWNGLNNRIRASILNLSAKMSRETTRDGQRVIEQVTRIEATLLDTARMERVYGYVDLNLLKKMRSYSEKFDPVSGGMHHFPGNWTPASTPYSFKTRDKAGNLQLTFATNINEDYLADIDLDDHAGIKHAVDVLKHIISDKNTDPYDIHEILQYFQSLDPEYSLL